MKTKTFLFASLCAISLTVMACGKKADETPATMDTAATTTTPAPSSTTMDTTATAPSGTSMDTAAHGGSMDTTHADTAHK